MSRYGRSSAAISFAFVLSFALLAHAASLTPAQMLLEGFITTQSAASSTPATLTPDTLQPSPSTAASSITTSTPTPTITPTTNVVIPATPSTNSIGSSQATSQPSQNAT